ncbi:hypothetical protein F2P56_035775 [Juglans regia]|uniref:Uncharacterized protein n=2 Tax=Juglans regia TaxID=51240 RepID=A0A833TAA4_JUGRE|nr:uncharacterized protein LOC108987106 [Juglans regia]KAF5443196.1 hypothetical protein F2P56_035775 [Juglans regia]
MLSSPSTTLICLVFALRHKPTPGFDLLNKTGRAKTFILLQNSCPLLLLPPFTACQRHFIVTGIELHCLVEGRLVAKAAKSQMSNEVKVNISSRHAPWLKQTNNEGSSCWIGSMTMTHVVKGHRMSKTKKESGRTFSLGFGISIVIGEEDTLDGAQLRWNGGLG